MVFFIFPSHIFIILYLFIDILYFDSIFIEFMGIFLYIIIIYFHRIRFTTTFIDFCISFTYKLLPYHFNNFYIHRYDINLHKIRISIFQSSFDWHHKLTILNNIKRKNRPIRDDFKNYEILFMNKCFILFTQKPIMINLYFLYPQLIDIKQSPQPFLNIFQICFGDFYIELQRT